MTQKSDVLEFTPGKQVQFHTMFSHIKFGKLYQESTKIHFALKIKRFNILTF